jgi:hypothetical protein
MSFLTTFFVKKTRVLSICFSDSKFETRVYWFLFRSKTDIIFFLHIFEDIFMKKSIFLKQQTTSNRANRGLWNEQKLSAG